MIDNDGTLVLKGQLTKIGKRRVLENNFDITKFAVADDGINYRLINENLVDPYLAIERSLLFNISMDSNIGIKHKLYIDPVNNPKPSVYNFNANVNNLNVPLRLYEDDEQTIEETSFENIQVNPKGFNNEILFPLTVGEDSRVIRYYVSNASVANQIKDIELQLPFESLPLRNENQSIIFTLHETQHFDVFLTESSDESIKKNWLHAYPANVQKEVYGSPTVQVVKESDHPKTVTMLASPSANNACIIRYKGNFKYENTPSSGFATFDDYLDKTKIYRTFLTITCEKTGRSQDISLELIVTEDKTES